MFLMEIGLFLLNYIRGAFMRKAMFNLFLVCLVLMYLATDNGQMKIRSFVEVKFNHIVSQTIGQPLDEIGQIFDEISR